MFFKFMQPCIMIGLMIYGGWAHADTFSLNKNAKIEPKATSQGMPKTKDIVVTGYGVTEEEALKTAFRAAVEQYVGVVIDSSTVVKNSALIEDSLLTASNGFIQTYKTISTNKKDGIVTIKILATVESQRIIQEIHSLHIATVSITSTKDIETRVVTKQIAKKDAEKILSKAWREAWTTDEMLDLLSVNIDSVKLLEDKMNKQNQVPLRVNYSITVNRDKYKVKIAKFETLLKQMGVKYYPRFDLPERGKNGEILSKLTSTQSLPESSFVLLMKHYGKGLVVDMWKFPKGWKLDQSERAYFPSIAHLILEIQDPQGEVLYPKMFEAPKSILFKANLIGNYYMNYAISDKTAVIPFLFSHNEYLEKISKSIEILIDLEDVKKLGNISLELEKK